MLAHDRGHIGINFEQDPLALFACDVLAGAPIADEAILVIKNRAPTDGQVMGVALVVQARVFEILEGLLRVEPRAHPHPFGGQWIGLNAIPATPADHVASPWPQHRIGAVGQETESVLSIGFPDPV